MHRLPGSLDLRRGPSTGRRIGDWALDVRELHGGLFEELLFSELKDVVMTTPHLSDLAAVSVANAIQGIRRGSPGFVQLVSPNSPSRSGGSAFPDGSRVDGQLRTAPNVANVLCNSSMPFGPHDAAKDAIRRANEMLTAADTSGLDAEVAADMRRSSLVIAVAAVDTYMHRLVVDRAFTHGKLPKKLAETEIRFDQLLSLADASYEAARRKPFNSRPRVAAKHALQNQLLLKTFQSPRGIEQALTMAGAPKGTWAAIGNQLSLTKKKIDARLNPIVMRRNQIVHEGDYERLDRPREARTNAISEAEARADIAFLGDLADAIHGAL